MSIEKKRSEEVFAVIERLFAEGAGEVRPSDVASVLREQNAPLGTWLIRAEFTALEDQGRIACNAQTGGWVLASSSALKDAG